MKEEMQGFHMTPNYKIFISEITLLNHLYTFNWIYPRIPSFALISLQLLGVDTHTAATRTRKKGLIMSNNK